MDNQKLIYIHIPKTAGSTIVDILKRNYGAGFHRLSNRGGYKRLHKQDWSFREQITCLNGHMPWGMHRYLPGSSVYATMLRHPLDRLISLYFYVLKNNDKLGPELQNISVADFVERRIVADCENGMTRFLYGGRAVGIQDHDGDIGGYEYSEAYKNLIRFHAVGLVEHFDESLELFARSFGWSDITYRVTNRNDHPGREALTQHDINRIMDCNRFDIKIYEEVVRGWS